MAGTRYVEYSADEVRFLLVGAGFEEVSLTGVRELTFERKTENKDVVIRVYSSIDITGMGRKCGSDAGRVVLIERTTGKPIWKGKRVHRTKGFLNNLRSRCRDAYRAVSGLVTCPKCDGYMIERKRKGESKPSFYGCLKYPACKGTRSIK